MTLRQFRTLPRRALLLSAASAIAGYLVVERLVVVPTEAAPDGSMNPAAQYQHRVFVPLVARNSAGGGCEPIPSETYNAITVNPPPTDRPAASHPDLNLSIRGYAVTNSGKSLVDYGGESDGLAPQLRGLFADRRVPGIRTVYRVYDWDWSKNQRGGLITTWPVTLAGLSTTPGETIHVPNSGYAIGAAAEYEVLVLYAESSRVTLKYTREDNVVSGYTIHLEGLCIEPRLLSLYHSMNSAGRGRLPALRPGQALGRAAGLEVGVAIRDAGTFMDPRSRKDWWVSA